MTSSPLPSPKRKMVGLSKPQTAKTVTITSPKAIHRLRSAYKRGRP